jgi:hypothetical protein
MARQCDKFDVRVSRDLGVAIKKQARARGCATASAFIRAGIEHELGGRETDALTGVEERLVASVDQVRRELFRIG